MAFIYEIVPEKDYAFFNSMHLKSPLGKGYICLSKYTKWCADKENNVYLIPHGGGLGDTPHFADLWYDGCIINIEIKQYGKRINGSVMVGWNVINLFIPEKIQNKTNFIVDIIKKALSVYRYIENEEMLEPKISCEPQKAKDCL